MKSGVARIQIFGKNGVVLEQHLFDLLKGFSVAFASTSPVTGIRIDPIAPDEWEEQT